MGCDIHGVIEVKLPQEQRWSLVSFLNDITPRDYYIFSYLFGVRGECQTGCDRRGYPDDVAWNTRHLYSNMCDGDHKGPCEDHMSDWHSLTWISFQELEPHLSILKQAFVEAAEQTRRDIATWEMDISGIDIEEIVASRNLDPEWLLIFDLMQWLSARYGGDQVRMIVWFDH